MKKKVLFTAILMIAMAFIPKAWAYDFYAVTTSGDTLYYTINGSEVSVTSPGSGYYGFTKPTGDLIIPSTVTNGGTTYSVTSIGNYAFSGCNGLTSVSIPNSVTSIGGYAFQNCTGLTSVTIPNSVTSIGTTAFSNCSGLTSVVFNADSCTFAGGTGYNVRAFNGCTNISSFVFGNNVKAIPPYLCHEMTNLTSIVIPDSVITIGSSAFSNCSGLVSVTIGNSVTTIENWAFSNCNGLTSVTLGNSVSSIADHAFENCNGLTSITFPNSLTTINGFFNCSGLTSVIIPNTATTIGSNAFAGCSGLTSINLPNSVTAIDNNAFSRCSGLTSITIPDSVTTIGSGAFQQCSGLTSITIPSTVTSIGNYAFMDCVGLTTVNYNAISCTSMGIYSHPVFIGCTNLTTLNIGNNVTNIPNDAFLGCSGLAIVIIPDSVTAIGQRSFKNCSGLTSVTIGSSVSSIDVYAFQNCSGLMEIISYADVAPTIIHENNNYSSFTGVPDTIPVYIPCGSSASYQAGWSCFSNFVVVEPEFTIDVQSANATMGNATIVTQFSCDSPAVIEATANEGYHFTQWNDGNTDNPRTVAVTSDTSFTAYFEADAVVVETYTVTVASADLMMGSATVNGEASATVEEGETVTLTATANEGYHFTQWNDGNTDNPRTVTVTSDTTFTAYFEADSGSEGVDGVAVDDFRIAVIDGRIVVEGTDRKEVRVFDMMGRQVEGDDLPSGTYLVKVGSTPARRIVVVR